MELKDEKLALVVDDNSANRGLLKIFLERDHYTVQEAENGLEAVELFSKQRASIVFMDLMMPVMDGIESCKQIKAIAGPDFIPVIFVTAVSEEDKLNECIDAGGDDFIAKPVDIRILNARLRSMERLIKLYDEYALMVAQSERDQEMAKEVFNSLMKTEHQALGSIKTLSKPAEIFSGDLFLSVFSPSGDLHVMLADFTGHGLGAALGAIPASEVFMAMVSKGFSCAKTLFAINNKLHNVLPTGMFMAVQYIVFRKDLDYISICNCGMPDIIIRDGKSNQIKASYASSHFPLGIHTNVEFHYVFEHVAVAEHDRIILFSDGLIEAINTSGEPYGPERLREILQRNDLSSVRDAVQQGLHEFCQGAVQQDDISLAEIPFIPDLFSDGVIDRPEQDEVALALHNAVTEDSGWEYRLVLEGNQLSKANPIPMIINQLEELEPMESDNQALYTILTELYVNALDHGVLELDSSLKSNPEGFAAYFSERERKLRELQHGRVSFELKGLKMGGQPNIVIRIEDSGQGFDIGEVLNRAPVQNGLALCGRGLLLVEELCHSLSFEKPGNRVEVIYAWNRESQDN